MIDYLIEKSTNSLSQIMNCDTDTYDKLKYGISIVYLNIFKTLLLFILSFALGKFNYVFVFFISYAFIRTYAAGVHVSNDLLCTIIGLTSIIGLVYLSVYVDINVYLYCILFVSCFIAYYLYAPAQTRKRPIAKKRAEMLKIKSLIVVLLLFVISLTIGSGTWRNLITYAVVFEAVSILPVTYKLLEGR